MPLRIYCRVAAIAFIPFTVYPSVVKIVEHRLAHDWAHGVLHLISAAIGIYAGLFARGTTLAALYTWTIGVVYASLGVGGWFIDGLLLSPGRRGLPSSAARKCSAASWSKPACSNMLPSRRWARQKPGESSRRA